MKTTTILITLLTLLTACDKAPEKIKYNYDISGSKSKATNIDSLISLLPSMKSNNLDCDADVYWKIIKEGQASIPSLINHLSDTTETNVYNICKQGKLNVGEICYFALDRISEFPAFLVTNRQFCLIINDCSNFYDYLFDNKNKSELQKMMREFYYSSHYTYEKISSAELTECHKLYKIDGRYKWKEKSPLPSFRKHL